MKEEVRIDWSTATDNQLSELYDALYERNDRVRKALDSIHFRLNLGDRYDKAAAFENDALVVSKDLADSIMAEVQERHKRKAKGSMSEFSCARPGGPEPTTAEYEAANDFYTPDEV